MEILSLDLFSCLFPVLTGLLDSRTERQVFIIVAWKLVVGIGCGIVYRSLLSIVCFHWWLPLKNWIETFTLFFMRRHVKVSLDLLLKLVAVFGPTIRATVSAPPSVGVDLHQEQRCPLFSLNIPFNILCSLYVNESNLYEISRTGGNAATSALCNCKKPKWFFQYWYGNHTVF